MNKRLTQLLVLAQTPVVCHFRPVRRSRHIRLSLYYDGTVLVTYPAGLAWAKIKQFIGDRQSWLIEQLNRRPSFGSADLRRQDRQHFLTFRQPARKLVLARLEFWNQYYDFKYHRVFIRRVRTRWGSCSAKGNLNFNYKIIFLPRSLQDYIIVHELCHLQEMNHSSRFWALVAQTLPDYQRFRRRLQW